MSETQKSFVKGAAILGAAGLIVKIIGALFRIPLTNVVGTQGMGYYQTAYPVYNMLLIISTAGLPVAISKMVSERTAKNDTKGAYDVFRVAWRVLLVLGIVTSTLMFFLADTISQIQNTPPAVYSLMAISPALFFVSILSAYRGYFQGMQYMVPTAVSQIIEQIIKLIVGLSLAHVLVSATGRPELGAMGAIIGVTVSEAIALLYMMGMFRGRKQNVLAEIEAEGRSGPVENFGSLLKQIVLIAIPITLGASVMPIVAGLDTVIVKTTLQAIGYTEKAAASMFGVLTGSVNPLINMPAVLSVSLSMSLVPAISQSVAAKNTREIKSQSSFGFKLALLVGLPAAVGFMVLANPIIRMLYKQIVVEGYLDMATLLLQIMSFGVLFLTIIQTLTGILQGLGKPGLPVISLAAGAVLKIVLSLTLIRRPEINIYGAAIGTVACYLVAAVVDVVLVVRHSGFAFSPVNHLLKPIVSTAVMAASVMVVYRLVGGRSNTIGVLASIVVAAIVYVVMLIVTGALTQEELSTLPGGNRLKKVLVKLRIWK